MVQNNELEKLRSELSHIKEQNSDLEHAVKNAQAERDLLAVMLSESENTRRRAEKLIQTNGEAGDWSTLHTTESWVASFANLSVAVLVLAGRGKIKTANTWTTKLTGYTRSELLDKEIGALFVQGNICNEILNLAEGNNSQMIEAQLKHKDGTVVLAGLIVSPRHGDKILLSLVDLGNRRPLPAL